MNEATLAKLSEIQGMIPYIQKMYSIGRNPLPQLREIYPQFSFIYTERAVHVDAILTIEIFNEKCGFVGVIEKVSFMDELVLKLRGLILNEKISPEIEKLITSAIIDENGYIDWLSIQQLKERVGDSLDIFLNHPPKEEGLTVRWECDFTIKGKQKPVGGSSMTSKTGNM